MIPGLFKLCFTVAGALILGLNSSYALKYDRNVPANIQKQMDEDLQFIAQISGTVGSPYHQQIFGAVDGKTYQSFFNQRITSVGMSSCGGGPAVACVQPFFNPNKMWLTKNFVNFNHPQIARLMVVFHEARHSESQNGNWGHETCPRPFLDDNGKDKTSIWTGARLEGEPACDKSAFGSYGSSTVMLKNISKFCTNCSSKVAMDADIFSSDQLGRIVSSSEKNDMLKDFQ